MSFRLTASAKADQEAIYRYTIETWGPRQAETYLAALNAVFEVLGDNPGLGRSVGGARRRYLFRKHYILYRSVQDGIVVDRVFHTSRNLPPSWR